MTTDLWALVRGLLGKRMPPRELEQAIAGWRPANSESAVKRERLHPMKGWVTDSADQPNDMNPRWKVRHSARER
jgi:hypothetical protein